MSRDLTIATTAFKNQLVAERVASRHLASRHLASRPIAIGALERGIRGLARQLEGMGLKVEIDVFKSGRGGTDHYGPSYVELDVTGEYLEEGDEEGQEQEASSWVKFIAGGYGTVEKGAFDDNKGLRWMKVEGLKYILKDLEWQGWKQP